MTGYFQGDAQAAIRAVTGTSGSYNSDWAALFDNAGIASGNWNGRFINWCNGQFSTAFTSFPEAWNYTVDYAAANGWAATVAAASGADWSSYDGTNNGTVTTLATSPNLSNHASALMSGTSGIWVGANADLSPADYETRLLTVDGVTVSLGAGVAELDVSSSSNAQDCVAMSATRFLFISPTLSDGTLDVALISEAGAVIDKLATAASFVEVIADYSSVTRHSDTVAVYSYRDFSTNDGYMVAIDISGDTITMGTPVAIDTPTLTGKPGIGALTATLGHVQHNGGVYRYTLSGTTITVGNKVNLTTIGNSPGSSDVIRIDDTHSLVVVTDNTPTGTYGVYGFVIADATTPTLATDITLLSDDDAVSNPDLQYGRCAVPVREDEGGSVDQVLVAVPELTGNIITIAVFIDTTTYALTDSGEVAIAGDYGNFSTSKFHLSQSGYNGKVLATYRPSTATSLNAVVISA